MNKCVLVRIARVYEIDFVKVMISTRTAQLIFSTVHLYIILEMI
jgi:hypothetical protein